MPASTALAQSVAPGNEVGDSPARQVDRGNSQLTEQLKGTLHEDALKPAQRGGTSSSSTSPSPLLLLDLPDEILSHIILPLPALDIMRSQAVCSKLNSIIAESVEIQYRIALEISGFEDNPACSTLSTSERLDRLVKGQKAWREFKPQFTTPGIKPLRPLSAGYHDLREGVFAPGSDRMSGVDYAMLPDREGRSATWKTIDLQEECFDVGSCWGEHDLIAVLTKVPVGNAGTFEIAVHLRQLSTGKPHPEAMQPRLSICKSESGPLGYSLNIAGENLAVRLTGSEDTASFPDRLLVFEWRTGRLKTSLVVPSKPYTDSALLEENVLLLANVQRGALEIWDIPQTVSPLSPSAPVCILELPPLAPGRAIWCIRCNGEPNPRGAYMPMGTGVPTLSRQQRPYRCNTQAIIAFDLAIEPSYRYSFFIHRKSILQIAEECRRKEASDSLSTHSDMSDHGRAPFPPPVSWEHWGQKVAMWVETGGMDMFWVHRSAGQRTVLIPENSRHSPSPIVVIDFNRWNVKRCRYALRKRKLQQKKEEGAKRVREQNPQVSESVSEGREPEGKLDDESAAAQDEVLVESVQRLEISSAAPSAVESGTDSHAEEGATDRNNSELEVDVFGHQVRDEGVTWTFLETNTVDIKGECFLSPVKSELPCILYSSTQHFEYDGVVMDEERILGLKTNFHRHIVEFDVHYFG